MHRTVGLFMEASNSVILIDNILALVATHGMKNDLCSPPPLLQKILHGLLHIKHLRFISRKFISSTQITEDEVDTDAWRNPRCGIARSTSESVQFLCNHGPSAAASLSIDNRTLQLQVATRHGDTQNHVTITRVTCSELSP
jgi:hypothetical protein